MSRRIRWGVLGVANIATQKVIPAMQAGERTEIAAIASRDPRKAEKAAEELGIPKAYGSYEDLVADPDIDAIYNPLPNHLHVPWSIKAAEAGKHVLCEKPIAMSAAECKELIAVRDRTGVKMAEAFMVATQPRWLKARDLIRAGRLGRLRAMLGFYSYYNVDPKNIRNVPEWGGGGVMDIGCYPIFFSRFVFGEEPVTVRSVVERDPAMKTDRLTSAILEFPSGQAIIACSTQLVNHQTIQFFGDEAHMDMDWPMNTPPDKSSYIRINDRKGDVETIEFPAVDQYTTQGDAFSKAIQENGEVPVSLEGAMANMRVIERVLAGGDRQK